MWDGKPVPEEVFEQGPPHVAAFKPEQVLYRLKSLRMPSDWLYAVPSARSRIGSFPRGWIPILVEHVKLGLQFPLDDLLTRILHRLQCTLGRLSPTIIFHSIMYRLACERLKEEPSFDAFRMIYNIRDSTNCWSIGRRENSVGFVTGAPKLDSPWYKEYFFARPSWKWYAGDAEPLTGYAVGSKYEWCESGQFPQSVRDHVARIIEGVQFRVQHSGSNSAYQLVRGFYGLRELADANRPKKKKAGRTTQIGDAPTSVAAKVIDLSTAPQTQSPVKPSGAASTSSVAIGRAAGKRVMERGVLEAASKRAKVGSPHTKAGEKLGPAPKRSTKSSSVAIPSLAAVDTEAAELALHTISELLEMPNEYIATSSESNRRLAGTASQFFFRAQIGFSQLILMNDRLSKTVDDDTVEIANLKKSLSEGRAAMIEELRSQIEKDFADQLARKDQELVSEKEATKAVREEKDRLEAMVQKSSAIEKALLEEQDMLRKEMDALKLEKASLLKDREIVVAAAQAAAGPAYLKYAEFLAYDKAKYKEVVGNVVAAIRHLIREECPDVAWDADRVWDAIGHWSSDDVNSEADDSADDEAGDEEGSEGEGEGETGSRGSPGV
ncbi:unnamed protein product [Linum trigynum]|uniref:Uncharacterized protein n=1 Tax=Linum trigynum TaxID=586398 RepID=A0AAV2CZU3_9ROSI